MPAKVEKRKVNKFEEEKRQAPSMVAAAVRKVGPSVVRIDTKRFIGPGRSYSSPFGGLFDDFDHQEENGQGSGIIFHEKGLILTNAHVVTRADEVMVTLTDGRRYKAVVKGTDELTDLAVLEMKSFTDMSDNEINLDRAKTKVNKSTNSAWEGEPLPVGIFGNSDEIEVGEYVIAVGNPVGLDNTVTMGIISAIKRSSEEVGIPNKKVPFIQTDAAINPGNSGGKFDRILSWLTVSFHFFSDIMIYPLTRPTSEWRWGNYWHKYLYQSKRRRDRICYSHK